MPIKDNWATNEYVTADDMNDIADAVNANESALGGKANTSHNHAAGDVNSGTFAIARIPTGTTSSTVCIGNDSRLSNTRTPTDNTVTTAKIQDEAVTLAKLAPGVTTGMQGLIHSTGPTIQVEPSPHSTGSVTVVLESSRQRCVVALSAPAPPDPIAVNAPTGTPADGWQLVYRMRFAWTASATWNAIFRPIGVDLPTSLTANKWYYIGCEYNGTDSAWDVLAVAEEA